jgi:hypothetical protein
MDISADGDGSVHLEHVGLGSKDLGAFFYDPQSLLFGQTALAIEVVLEKLEIGFGAIVRRQELLLGRWEEGGCLDIWMAGIRQRGQI